MEFSLARSDLLSVRNKILISYSVVVFEFQLLCKLD
jgi:hypothetical protein